MVELKTSIDKVTSQILFNTTVFEINYHHQHVTHEEGKSLSWMPNHDKPFSILCFSNSWLQLFPISSILNETSWSISAILYNISVFNQLQY